MTAAELSGDATTSGSNVVTVGKVNGGSIPSSQPILASNASNQIVGASTTGSGTTAVLSTNPTFTSDIVTPIVYGGIAAGSTLTLDGTSNGSPSSAFVLINSSGQGNVGVGVTTPTTLKSATTLQVGGNIKIGATNSSGLISLGDTNYTGANVGIWRGVAGAFGAGGNYLALGGYDGITFATGNSDIDSQTQRMVITSTGKVGIGDSSPNSPLAVVGLPVYANNAAAIAGGLAAGDFYRSGGDPDLVCVTH
jgi:hypothetical protein